MRTNEETKLMFSSHRDGKRVVHPKIIESLQAIAFKINNRTDLRPDQKIAKLNELAKRFHDGWPFDARPGSQHQMCEYGRNPSLPEYRNLLETNCKAIADRIHRMELVKQGKNIGQLDTLEGDAAKKFSTDKKTAEKKVPVIEKKS